MKKPEKNDLHVNLLKRRIQLLAAQMFTAMCRYRKLPRIPYNTLQPRSKKLYIRLAAFTMTNRLHPFLYLRVMAEFQVHLYPTNLYGEIALTKYHAYIKRIRQRYRDLKTYTSNISDPSLNILRNDLYLIASICDPVSSPAKFFSDIEKSNKVSSHASVGERFEMYGFSSLKGKFPICRNLVDKKTRIVIRAITDKGSIADSGYSHQIKAALHVR